MYQWSILEYFCSPFFFFFLVSMFHQLHVCLCPAGELINLALYCERIRRRFWPEWFVDVEDFCYKDITEKSNSASRLPDLGLYSRTDTFQDNTPQPSRADTPRDLLSPESDPTGHSLYDSDMDTECSEIDQLKCWHTHIVHTAHTTRRHTTGGRCEPPVHNTAPTSSTAFVSAERFHSHNAAAKATVHVWCLRMLSPLCHSISCLLNILYWRKDTYLFEWMRECVDIELDQVRYRGEIIFK